jgi:hypothetical protein
LFPVLLFRFRWISQPGLRERLDQQDRLVSVVVQDLLDPLEPQDPLGLKALADQLELVALQARQVSRVLMDYRDSLVRREAQELQAQAALLAQQVAELRGRLAPPE